MDCEVFSHGVEDVDRNKLREAKSLADRTLIFISLKGITATWREG